MVIFQAVRKPPFTSAVRQALRGVSDSALEADLLFLEAWEMRPTSQLGAILRASQIRRANPGLAAAIGAELRGIGVVSEVSDEDKKATAAPSQ